MSQKIAEMEESELLSQWANLPQTDARLLNRIKGFRERATGLLKGSDDFYSKSQEFMSLEEIRRYLKYLAQLKDLVNTGNDLLDNLEKLQKSYKMRLTR